MRGALPAWSDPRSTEDNNPPTCLHRVQLGVRHWGLDNGGLLGRLRYSCLIAGWRSGLSPQGDCLAESSSVCEAPTPHSSPHGSVHPGDEDISKDPQSSLEDGGESGQKGPGGGLLIHHGGQSE